MTHEEAQARVHEAIGGLLDDGELAVAWTLTVDVAAANDTRYLTHRAGGGVDGADAPMIWAAIGMLRAGLQVAEDQLRDYTEDVDDDDPNQTFDGGRLVNPVRKGLYTRLTADATLMALVSGVHYQVAPQGAPTPFVVFHRQAGTPEWRFGGAHVQSDLWLVRAVDRGSSASRSEDIAARIDEVLTDAPLSIDENTLLAVYRESDIDYSENDGGETYRHCGALFRLVSAPA